MRKIAAFLIRKALPLLITAAAGFGLGRVNWPAPTEQAVQTAADQAGKAIAEELADKVEGK